MAEDTRAAVREGCEDIVVSNDGGRRLDGVYCARVGCGMLLGWEACALGSCGEFLSIQVVHVGELVRFQYDDEKCVEMMLEIIHEFTRCNPCGCSNVKHVTGAVRRG